MAFLNWSGIILCLSQSAMLSGLNLGLLTLSRLELQVLARKGDRRAAKVLSLRENANFMLVTILWSNVAVNVLLALLSGSVLSGVAAFFFSTVVITIFAEIAPQAYFSRHALAMAARLAPVLRMYQFFLYPVARPTAWILDRWLGGEQIRFFQEQDLRRLIQLHMEAAESDIARVEGQGALNFLAIDDVPLDQEGEPVDRASVVTLPFDGDEPLFPRVQADVRDPFLLELDRSKRSWTVIVDPGGEPRLLLRTNDFIREALFSRDTFDPLRHCCRPIVIRSGERCLGELLPHIRVSPGAQSSNRVVNTAILLWDENPRILTGTDILDRLLRGITGAAKT
jgi:metal transporter CNNM